MGERVRFGGGRTKGEGYLASSARVGPGVVILHEFYGLTPSFLAFADRLNDEGFTALAVDLYGGRTAPDVAGARALAQGLDAEATAGAVAEAVEHLRMNWHPRVGVIGFSLGAPFATGVAQSAGVDATVVYYGYPDMVVERWDVPLLGHFCEGDEWEPIEEITPIFDALGAAGVDAEMHVYPGARHGFANADLRDAYSAEDAERAWRLTLGFLRHYLS